MRYGYVRVSTDMQEYAAQKNAISSRFQIDEWIEDTGTGKITQPNLAALLSTVKANDEIVVYAFDRLGRKTQQVLSIAEDLKKKGVGIVSIREGIDMMSPSGNMVFQMMCSIAEFEASLIADRVRAGMKSAKDRGVILGPKKLATKADKIPYLEMAKALRKEGKSYRFIQKTIRSHGGELSYGTIHNYTRGI